MITITDDMFARPKYLEWVYMYFNKNTHNFGYIGRAKNSNRCAIRIMEHRSEEWCKDKDWTIAFCPCLNRTESEMMETLCINTYHPNVNKDKVGWGLLLGCHIPEVVDLPQIKESERKPVAYIQSFLETYEREILSTIKDFKGGNNELNR